MLTKSKVLSNTGVEIGGSKFSNVVNTNINITTDKANTDDKQATSNTSYDIEKEGEVKYNSATQGNVGSQVASHEDVIIEFLNKIIQLYSNNQLKIEGKLVLHNDELINLITLIIKANYPTLSDVVVNIKVDYEVNCCGSSKGLNIISKILVNNTHDMKYVYNEEYNTLMRYGISLKYTLD